MSAVGGIVLVATVGIMEILCILWGNNWGLNPITFG